VQQTLDWLYSFDKGKPTNTRVAVAKQAYQTQSATAPMKQIDEFL